MDFHPLLTIIIAIVIVIDIHLLSSPSSSSSVAILRRGIICMYWLTMVSRPISDYQIIARVILNQPHHRHRQGKVKR